MPLSARMSYLISQTSWPLCTGSSHSPFDRGLGQWGHGQLWPLYTFPRGPRKRKSIHQANKAPLVQGRPLSSLPYCLQAIASSAACKVLMFPWWMTHSRCNHYKRVLNYTSVILGVLVSLQMHSINFISWKQRVVLRFTFIVMYMY